MSLSRLTSAVLGTMGQTMSSYKGGADFKHHSTNLCKCVSYKQEYKDMDLVGFWKMNNAVWTKKLSSPSTCEWEFKKVQHRPLVFACVQYANSRVSYPTLHWENTVLLPAKRE